MLPARALPVPFWAQGLRPPPRTSLLPLTLCVPCDERSERTNHKAEKAKVLAMSLRRSAADRCSEPVVLD